ncbi:MAG: ABC transporter ATP-binding protein [Nocardioidaceae bacterium]
MNLDAHVVVRRPGFDINVEIQGQAGDTVALLGPNGAGKTTCLRAVAGLQPIDAGRVLFGGIAVEDPSQHIRVPASLRDVGLVFQDHLLFPHLSARDNVAFGLRSRGTRKQQARATATAWLQRVGIGDLADRKPRNLSGGQAQRVAIARALVTNPSLLLLDEPLAALDAGAKMTLRSELRRHLEAFPGVAVLVTHDALDALMLADTLVVLDEGVVVQRGTPEQVSAHPRSDHVARLVGLNLVRGTANGTVVTTGSGVDVVSATDSSGDVFASFRPSAVALDTHRPTGSQRNAWRTRITELAPYGDVVRLHLEGELDLVADVTPQAITSLALDIGDPVWAVVKATEISVYPA